MIASAVVAGSLLLVVIVLLTIRAKHEEKKLEAELFDEEVEFAPIGQELLQSTNLAVPNTMEIMNSLFDPNGPEYPHSPYATGYNSPYQKPVVEVNDKKKVKKMLKYLRKAAAAFRKRQQKKDAFTPDAIMEAPDYMYGSYYGYIRSVFYGTFSSKPKTLKEKELMYLKHKAVY